MKAVRLLGNKKLEVINIPKPVPGIDEVMVEMANSGICSTDIEFIYGSNKSVDIIPGHEVAGIIDNANNSIKFKKGDRVMLNCHHTCGKCIHCQNGDLIFCPELETLGNEISGGDAEFFSVPESMVRLLPEDISFESGIIISDALGTAYHAAKKVNISSNAVLGIIGMGSLGLMCVVCVKHFGGVVVALDLIPERLEIAKRFGADVVLNPEESSIKKYLKDNIEINGFDTVIDFSGSSKAVNSGADLLKPKGKLVLGGVCRKLDIDPFEKIIAKELTIMGTRNYNNNELKELFDFVREKHFIEDIITHRFSLDDAEEAFKVADRREGIKVVLTP